MATTLMGTNAVITGGLGDIGMEVVKALLKQNVNKIAIIDKHRNENRVTMLKTDYPDRVIMFVQTDVMKKADVTEAYVTIMKEFKELHFVVNCAGILNDLDIETTIGVNVNGVIFSTLIAREYMRTDKGGKGGIILNMASITGLFPLSMFSVYCASKWAVTGFTRSMADDYHFKQTGIKYICICPGLTHTALAENLTKKVWDPEWAAMAEKVCAKFPLQMPDAVGSVVIEAIKSGKNGSVWQVEANIIKEIRMEDAYDITTLLKDL